MVPPSSVCWFINHNPHYLVCYIYHKPWLREVYFFLDLFFCVLDFFLDSVLRRRGQEGREEGRESGKEGRKGEREGRKERMNE